MVALVADQRDEGVPADEPLYHRHAVIAGTVGLVFSSVVLFMALRFGLLTLATGSFFGSLQGLLPMSLDFSPWYASALIVPALCALSITLFAFYHSLAGRAVFGEALAEES